MLPPCCHDKPGTLRPTCFILQPGRSQGNLEKVTGWYSVSVGYTSRGGFPSARGCHPLRPTRGASWCLSIISTKTSTQNWYASIRYFPPGCPLILNLYSFLSIIIGQAKSLTVTAIPRSFEAEVFTGQMPFLSSNQQRQSTESKM